MNRTGENNVKTLAAMKLNLGKLLYPRLSADQRRRQIHILLVVVLTALVIAGAMALVMFEADKPILF